MVAAKETALRSILEGTKQYQVPLYQRTYSWTLEQVQRLWSDVVDLTNDRMENETQTHFIGSLVLAPSPSLSPAGVQHFLVIDGQQRLTTLTLLLAAIREHRAKHEDPSHRDRINDQFLINKWQEDQPLKVLPTQKDQGAYNSWIRGVKTSGSDGGIGTASRFFQAQLLDYDDPDDPLDVDRLEAAVIDGLPGVTTFDPWPTFCSADTCSALNDGVVVYSDASHLNQAGSQLFVAPLQEALSRIAEAT